MVHVFLLIGQSNMVGRDPAPLGFSPDPRIEMLTDGRDGNPENQIEVAVDPLRHDKPGVVYGPGPGRPFARALLPHLPADDRILLVNRAWGGSVIADWQPDHPASGYSTSSGYHLAVNLYQTAVAAFRAAWSLEASRGHTPAAGGILWLQGESDADAGTAADAYRQAVVRTLTSARNDLGWPELPVVISEFHRAYGGAPGRALLAALRRVADDLGAALVSGEGTEVLGDGVHLTTASQRLIGERMASAYLRRFGISR